MKKSRLFFARRGAVAPDPLGSAPIRRRAAVASLLLPLCAALLMTGCLYGDGLPARNGTDLVVAVRESPIVHAPDADERALPYEQILIERFAAKTGRSLKLVKANSHEEIQRWLRDGRIDFGAAWFTETGETDLRLSQSFHHDNLVLVQHDASLPLESIGDLANKTLHVAAGSRYAVAAERLQREVPSLTVVARPDPSGLDLLRAVAGGEVELTIAAGEIATIAQNYFPDLQTTLKLAERQPIGWLFAANGDPKLIDSANAFLMQLAADGSLLRLQDTHLAFRSRLNRLDIVEFIGRSRTRLAQYEPYFREAQIRSGIDWRLIAALSYQESHWNPLATSFTGVRGMMMLTEDTADRMRVKDRLDPRQSILAGADYLAILRDELPASVMEPDRTWLALAAYNLGMGHLNGARAIALRRHTNPDQWHEMKRILPLLSRPEIYARLKAGKARGGEAVILVENIRAYYDILALHMPPYAPFPQDAQDERTKLAELRPAVNADGAGIALQLGKLARFGS